MEFLKDSESDSEIEEVTIYLSRSKRDRKPNGRQDEVVNGNNHPVERWATDPAEVQLQLAQRNLYIQDFDPDNFSGLLVIYYILNLL